MAGCVEHGPSQNERVFLTTGRPCPARCTYCFALQPGYVPPADTASHFVSLTQSGDRVIHPACDTDLLAYPDEALATLNRLSLLYRFITFSTKLSINRLLLEGLSEIDQRLRDKGGRLSITISIPKIHNLNLIERDTAPIQERIENLQVLTARGISTVTAIRPVLDTLTREEVVLIVRMASEFCHDYTDGLLYLKVLGRFQRGKYSISRSSVPWLSHDHSEWYILDATENRKFIRACVQDSGLKFWDSNVDAVLGGS